MLCDFTPSCIFQRLDGAWIISILITNQIKNLTWKFSKIRLYSIFVYVHAIWGDILPNCDNHTRSIMKFKYRLYQTLSMVFSLVSNSLKIQNRYRTGLELLAGMSRYSNLAKSPLPHKNSSTVIMKGSGNLRKKPCLSATCIKIAG